MLTRELDAIDRTCSRFRGDSELVRMNAASGEETHVSALLFDALRTALDAARATGGLVDPTIGRTLRLAGYDATFSVVRGRDGRLVRPSFVRDPNWRTVELDETRRTVRAPKGVELDLGATAKALAADRAADRAHAATGTGVLISLGGDIAVAGTAPETWLVGSDRRRQRLSARHRRPSRSASRVGGLATSGTTVRRWASGARRLHHIVDPRTGRPASACWRSATVAAESCVDANTASTAAIVLGERAPEWLDELQLPARLLRYDRRTFFVARLAGGGGGRVIVAASNPTTLWYLTRATGVVALLLLTAAVVFGVLSSIRWRSGRLPRFLVGGLHRNVTLIAIAFVAMHVVTTVADGYAPVGLRDAVIPFVSPYRPIWLGLGAVAFDLLLALVITSFLRMRLGFRMWRAVHWLAYASWPVALLHSLGTGSDARLGWMTFVGFASFALVAVAVLLRVARSEAATAPRVTAAAAAFLTPLAIFVWYQGGPQQRGWAARAGTPSSLLHRATATPSTSPWRTRHRCRPAISRHASPGTSPRPPRSDGLVTVDIKGRVRGRVHGNLRLTLWGQPAEGGGIVMTSSDVAFAAAGTASAYSGHVVSLDGNRVETQLKNAAGARADITFDLQLDRATNAISGSVQGRTTA